MKTRMFLTGALAVCSVAFVCAPVAAADDFIGSYAYRPGVGATAGAFSSLWTVTPCGDDCRHIVSANGATDTEAHLEGPFWVFERFVDPGVECPPNSYTIVSRKVPATMRFKINSDSLIGQYQPVGTPCGGTAPPAAFSLTKTIDGDPPPITDGLSALPSAGAGAGGGAHGGGH